MPEHSEVIASPTVTPTPVGLLDVVANNTPFGALGWSVAIAIVVASLVFSIGFIGLLWVVVISKRDIAAQRLASAIKTASEIFCSKFRQIRPIAIIFGVLLTVITITLLTIVDLAHAKEAFWLALGVVLGTFANAITKLTEGTDDNPQEPKRDRDEQP